MPIATTIAALTAVAATFGHLARRDARRVRLERGRLLDACLRDLTRAQIVLGADGFPCLSACHAGQELRAQLIPDTMTIRRLPQLWLSVTLVAQTSVPAEFAVLVRPSGNDFFSLTEKFAHRLVPSAGMPWEVMARGDGDRAAAQALLDALAEPLSAVLSDPRVKEVAMTKRGVRIVRQAAEGQRGDHVLLRQAVFSDARVSAPDFASIVAQLEALRAAVPTRREALAA